MKFHWKKTGCVFKGDYSREWSKSHAQLPTVLSVGPDKLRVYYCTRDGAGRAHVSYYICSAANPSQVSYVHDKPVLAPGSAGAFDDAGVMPGCAIDAGDVTYLYYTGWSLRGSVPYQTETGLAISSDGGESFDRHGEGPLFGRTRDEPFVNGSPFVFKSGDNWWCWYHTGTEWRNLAGKWEANYRIVSATSRDGLAWERNGDIAIDFKSADEGGIGRGTVIRDANKFRMWFSYRHAGDFRAGGAGSYRIGYADSDDGLKWQRDDESAGIDVGSGDEWDSEMVAYPYVFEADGATHMLYNGNGFGKTGIGHAIMVEQG